MHDVMHHMLHMCRLHDNKKEPQLNAWQAVQAKISLDQHMQLKVAECSCMHAVTAIPPCRIRQQEQTVLLDAQNVE